MEDARGTAFAGLQTKAKGPFGDYAPASGAIQGILKGMYDAFTGDLEKANADEGKKQKEYEELRDTKSAELTKLTETLGKKKETFGTDQKTMTDASVERDETTATLATDEKFFDETKEACKAKADEWAERSRLRTEELSGIVKAVEILTSDEAQATFSKATSMLLQSAQSGTSKQQVAMKAFASLRAIARKSHSLRRAAVSASLSQMASKGGLDVVITSVDKMLAELRQEEQDDITLRDYCQAEENKVETEIEDLKHEMETISGFIERLNAKKTETLDEIKQTETDIDETQKAMAEALSNRNKENEDFKAALKDDMDAVALIASAIDALTSFYKNNKLPLGLMQKHGKKDPEYSVDPDKAPETFSAPYGGRSSEGGGITSIMGYIKEDLENEIKTSKQDEASSQKEFEEQRKTALESLEALNQKKVTLENLDADLDEKIAESTEEHTGKATIKSAKKKYKEDLVPKCEWMKTAFEDRRVARQDEMTGLMKAKASLAGGEEGEELVQRGAFLQKRRKA